MDTHIILNQSKNWNIRSVFIDATGISYVAVHLAYVGYVCIYSILGRA